MKRTATEEGFQRQTRHKTVESSKVLHVRNLPSFTSDAELMALCMPYGAVTTVLVMAHKNQGFVEMADANAAQSALAGLEAMNPSIRGKNVYFQFSSRTSITKSNSASSNAPLMGGQISTPGSVLMLNILNAAVPVTLDNIYQISKPYGDVLRIITFTKGTNFNALVEFASPDHATQAKNFLDGKDMFQGCCTLQINWSKRQSLVVQQNNHKSWDFTKPQGQGGAAMGGMMGGMNQGMLQQQQPGMMGGGMGAQAQDPYMMNMQMPAFGGQMAGMAQDMGSKVVIVSGLVTSDQIQAPLVDQIFNLFGYYGDVQRVKILFTKRDTALVQFQTSQQAQLAASNLQDCPFNGAFLKVNISKFPEVTPSQDGTDEKGNILTKEFSKSPDHRYRQRSFMNIKNINPPSQVVHVANISDDVTDEALSSLFATAQAPNTPVPTVEFFKKSHNQAYVCMASVADAVRALVAFHSYTLGRYPLRVSFSHREPERVGQVLQQHVQQLHGIAPTN